MDGFLILITMSRKIISFLLIIFLIGCRQQSTQLIIPTSSEIVGLASTVHLNIDSTIIYMEDYFNNVSLIDSVFLIDDKISLSSDKKQLLIIADDNALPLMELKVWSFDTSYSILVEKSRKKKVNLIFIPKGKNYKKVQLAGEMNGWNPSGTFFKFKDSIWQIELLLNPGEYQYKLVVENMWILDPANPDSVDNNIGGYNSLLTVGKANVENTPVLFTKKAGIKKIKIGFKNNITEVFVFWQNYSLPGNYINIKSDKIDIKIPEEAKKYERSYIRVWAYNKNGVSNDILIPLINGKVLDNPAELKREDLHASIIYNVFVDRFYNGNPENDEPLDDPEVLPKANYFGGDIAGITKKIKEGYFTELGINTIWISPIVQNPQKAYGLWPDPRTKFSGYHGYWPISFTRIDYRFGTVDEFKEMVTEAHARGFNVLLDFVANHVHEDHPVYQAHPDWATNLYLPDGTLNTEKWDEHRLTTWFDTFLPTLDLSKPEVVEMLTDSAVFWIKEYNLDGFRHDATKHIPEIFWRTLTKKLKEQVMIPQNKLLYQIGETYGSPELISSYVNSGELDAQFDFNVYDDAVAVFARDNESFTRLNNSIKESFTYYGNHNLMGYITDNQDRARFISYAGGALAFDEDTKLAGWTREIEVGNNIAYKKLSSLTAFIMTIPGIPIIYFGDEIGDPGGNDPDNRRMMRFENLKKEEIAVKETAKKLIKLRKENLPLIFGDYETLKVSENIYAFARTYFDKIAVVVFNKNSSVKNIIFNIPERFSNDELKSNFGSKFNLENNELKITLEGNSFEVLIK